MTLVCTSFGKSFSCLHGLIGMNCDFFNGKVACPLFLPESQARFRVDDRGSLSTFFCQTQSLYHDSDSFSMTSFLANTREQSSQRFLSGSMVSW